MVEAVAGEVAAKVSDHVLDTITHQFGNLFNYRRNIRDPNDQIDSLDRARERILILVDEANRQGQDIFPAVQHWLTCAQGTIQTMREDVKRASSSCCFHLKSRHPLSKRAKIQGEEIAAKINEARDFGDTVSYRPPPPPLSFNDYEDFQSRTTTFNQIMAALANEGISVIGVWGMGGVGKTTLVKQAEEDDLFHKVVIALNISQTPNISEIQAKLATRLGLTLEENNNDARAAHLRQSLKKQEKVLVILDDLWSKLKLEEIGIPYGDDHQGCKLLLTSRERGVLDTDMLAQKVFHLGHLNEEESWCLFKKTAGNSMESLELRPIAVKVIRKCEGLPIAIVTIANALKNKGPPVWENALEELRASAPTNIRGVSEDVYSCLELSYNHLESDEAKSLFLLCGMLGVGDISMDRLLQYAMGLNLFRGLYSWDKAENKLITLVESLKVSSLLLDSEGGNNRHDWSLFFNDDAFLRMHDVVRDVARSIASKVPHRCLTREAVGSEEAAELREWQMGDECRNSTRFSLMCRNIDKLAQTLVFY